MKPVHDFELDRLLRAQRPDGSWCIPILGDAAFEIDMMFLLAFLGRDHDPRWPGLMRTVISNQRDDGGWAGDVGQTLLARFALRLGGLDDGRPALTSAADWLAGVGRGSPVPVRARLLLALFEQCAFPAPGEIASDCATELCAMQATTQLRPVTPWPTDRIVDRCLDSQTRSTGWQPWAGWKARRLVCTLVRLIHEQPAAEGRLSIWPLVALARVRSSAAECAAQAVWRRIEARQIADRSGTRFHTLLQPARDTARVLGTLLDHGALPTDPVIRRGADWLARWLLRSPDANRGEIAEAAAALQRCREALPPERRAILDRVAS